jgi:hypothetical protein
VAPDGDPELGALLGREPASQAVVVRPAQVTGLRVEQVEDGALPADQAARQLDDLLEDLRRVAQCRDAGGDLAKRLFRVRPAGKGLA